MAGSTRYTCRQLYKVSLLSHHDVTKEHTDFSSSLWNFCEHVRTDNCRSTNDENYEQMA